MTLQSERQHFLTLDGLRGVAALCVLLGHLNWVFWEHVEPQTFLAVDFFYMLSGFVISYAYDHRLARGLSVTKFMVLRYKRLLPLMVVGAIAGFCFLLVRSHLVHEAPLSGTALVFVIVCGILMLPLGLFYNSPVLGDFPCNPPAFSVFFELVANFVFALFWKRLTWPVLLVLIAISGVALGISIERGYWPSLGPQPNMTYFIGTCVNLIRVFFSFFVGVALFRIHDHPALARIGALHPLIGTVLLVLIFNTPESIPYMCVPAQYVAFPLIILASAKYNPEDWLARVTTASGWLSYPIYAIHFPIYRYAEGALTYTGMKYQLPGVVWGVTLVICTIAIAVCFGIFYDVPVRKWLQQFPKKR